MRLLPRNLLTLYADLAQNVTADAPRPATISRRMENGKRRLYALTRDGAVTSQTYLGTAGDPAAETLAAAHRRSAVAARLRRRTVSTLRRSGIFAPDTAMGRVIEVLANAGLFRRGIVLIGTAAYQLYPCVVGAELSIAALQTQDADVAFARLAVRQLKSAEPLDAILKRADPTFAPRFAQSDKWPSKYAAANGLLIEVLTHEGRSKPVLVEGLGCEAIPLRFMEYLVSDPIDVVALVGAGVPVRVPDPARYAIHKLIVSQARHASSQKAGKDLDQARELIEIFRATDPDRIDDAMHDARRRGPAWRKSIDAAMRRL